MTLEAIVNLLKPYGKFIVCMVGAALNIGILFGAWKPGDVKWAIAVVSLTTAFFVYQVPNKKPQ